MRDAGPHPTSLPHCTSTSVCVIVLVHGNDGAVKVGCPLVMVGHARATLFSTT